MFEDVKEINLKGEMWETVGIIFGLGIKQIDGILKTDIDASLGLCGEITSGKIMVK